MIVDSVYGQKLSVRETEQMIKRIKSEPAAGSARAAAVRLDLEPVCERLGRMGVSVSAGTNKVTIVFKDENEIAHFLDKLG